MAVDQDLFFSRRLGLGLKPDETLGATPREWAMDQLRSVPPVDFFDKDGNSIVARLDPLAAQSAKLAADYVEACHQWEIYKNAHNKLDDASKTMSNQEYQDRNWKEIVYPYKRIPVWRDALAKTLTAVNGKSPVFERFWMFWCNHFVVALQNAEIELYWGVHERNIRKHMVGTFADMVRDAILDPAMLIYLNNDTSVGPHSQKARDPQSDNHDLNENLGRELLELHTVSPAAGYAQKDVTEAALILTGWQQYAGAISQGKLPASVPYGTFFHAPSHEPGPRTVMGKTYKPIGKGDNQALELINDLASHPQTAHHLATKLARAFVADEPPPESVDRIAKVFLDTTGDMVAVHSAVVEEVLTYATQYSKMTTPENWLVQSYRVTGAEVPLFPPSGGLESIQWVYKEMGQALEQCPQPNGYSELMADWLSRAMVDRRVRQAYRMGQAAGALSVDTLGDYAARLAGADAPLVTMIRHAESRPIAVALLLTSPQFLKI